MKFLGNLLVALAAIAAAQITKILAVIVLGVERNSSHLLVAIFCAALALILHLETFRRAASPPMAWVPLFMAGISCAELITYFQR